MSYTRVLIRSLQPNTLRDLDANVILLHGPAGCGFMPSRRLEEAGVRVVTTGMTEQDLIFGSQESRYRILRQIESEFHPKLVGVVGHVQA